MSPDLEATLQFTRQILGAGIALQSAETFLSRRIYGDGGALESQTFKSAGDVCTVTALRFAAGAWLMFPSASGGGKTLLAGMMFLIVSTVYLTLRSRGPTCGGSDSMFFQVQIGLLLAQLRVLHPLLPKIGLAWIAAQSVLSYLLAGVSKLRNPRWRNGDALKSLLTSQGAFVLFEPARRLAGLGSVCTLLGWGVVLLELSFPLALVLPLEGKLMLLIAGLAFHIVNAAVLGLNRFIWAWAATYPAMFYFGSS